MRRTLAPFCAALVLAALSLVHSVLAQTPPAEFDVVSITRSAPDAVGSSMRTMPDGTSVMTNVAVSQFITGAAPLPVRQVAGLPAWANSERYDVTAKPPPGSTPEQRRQMWQTMFAQRMQLVAHVEEREQDVFALVLARSDGRLGPQLKPSTLDCSPRPPGTPPAPPPRPASDSDYLNYCGLAPRTAQPAPTNHQPRTTNHPIRASSALLGHPLLRRSRSLTHVEPPTEAPGCVARFSAQEHADFSAACAGSQSGTALALTGAAALVTRSWDTTTAPPLIGGRRTVPPDTSHIDARLGPQ